MCVRLFSWGLRSRCNLISFSFSLLLLLFHSPEAKFTYDLSPIAVSYTKRYRAWYDYFTSVMAIIGGTFTVVGMLESGIHSVSSKKRR